MSKAAFDLEQAEEEDQKDEEFFAPLLEFEERVVLPPWPPHSSAGAGTDGERNSGCRTPCGSNRTKRLSFVISELPFAEGVAASTGGQLWGASVALARSLLENPPDLRQEDVETKETEERGVEM